MSGKRKIAMNRARGITMSRACTIAAATLALSIGATSAAAQDVRDVFRRVSASVVVVRTVEQGATVSGRDGRVGLPGLGSGVIITADGQVLTASHVVQAAERIAVELPSGRLVPAHVIASSPPGDVALLQLDELPEKLSPANLGDSDQMVVGDEILVVGTAYGMGPSLSVGHIGARVVRDRSDDALNSLEMFQTGAAMNPGNSGGPMFNLRGEVVGVASSIISQSGGFEGVGFAITSNVARRLLLQQRGLWLGADGYLLHGELAKVFNVPQPAGVLVQRVARNSPAARIGLRSGRYEAVVGGEAMIAGGDIILWAAGVPVEDRPDALDRVHAAVSRLAPGDQYTVMVLRGGSVLELTGTIPGP